MKFYKFVVDNSINFYRFELDLDIQHLVVVLDSTLSENVKEQILFRLNYFLLNYIQKTRCLRVLDLRNAEGLKEAYYSIWSIYEIYLPSSVKKVDFRNAKSLRYVSAMGAESIVIYDSPLLEKVDIGKCLRHIHMPYTGIAELTIPPKCRFEYNNAFEGCKNLRRIDISNSLDCPSGTFRGCINLVEVILPNHIKTLEKDVFKDCHSLKIIRGGKSIEHIEDESLKECPLLEFIDEWKLFINKDGSTIAKEFFTRTYQNQVGTAVLYFRNNLVLWSFTNNRYYLLNSVQYKSYAIDGYIRPNELVVFNVIEAPQIEHGTQLCLKWNLSCTKIEILENLSVPKDGLCMSTTEQQDLLEFFRPSMKFDIFCKQIKASIDGLNIDEIIESYTITRRNYWQIRPGRDDFEWYECEAKSCYSDPYIDTLLPPENTKIHESGCCPLGFDESEASSKLQKEADEEAHKIKENAKKVYSKLNHYSFLLKTYLDKRANLEAKIVNEYKLERIKEYIMHVTRLHVEEIYTLFHNLRYSDIFLKDNILLEYERYDISALRSWLRRKL